MAVKDDVVTCPDRQRIAAAFGLDALAQCQVFPPRLQGDQLLELWVDLDGLRVSPPPVGGIGLRLAASGCSLRKLRRLGRLHGCVSWVIGPAMTVAFASRASPIGPLAWCL